MPSNGPMRSPTLRDMSETQTDQADDQQLTETAKTRWEWLSTLTAAALVTGFLGVFVAMSLESFAVAWPGGLPGYTFLAAFAAAVTYAIGEDVTAIINEFRGGQGVEWSPLRCSHGRRSACPTVLSWRFITTGPG